MVQPYQHDPNIYRNPVLQLLDQILGNNCPLDLLNLIAGYLEIDPYFEYYCTVYSSCSEYGLIFEGPALEYWSGKDRTQSPIEVRGSFSRQKCEYLSGQYPEDFNIFQDILSSIARFDVYCNYEMQPTLVIISDYHEEQVWMEATDFKKLGYCAFVMDIHKFMSYLDFSYRMIGEYQIWHRVARGENMVNFCWRYINSNGNRDLYHSTDFMELLRIVTGNPNIRYDPNSPNVPKFKMFEVRSKCATGQWKSHLSGHELTMVPPISYDQLFAVT